MTPERVDELCAIMHDAYEQAATEEGRETQERSRVPWTDVPEANKATMRKAVKALLDAIAPANTAPDERCQRCGGPNVIWHTASPLWNEVMRGGSINGKPRFGDMVCPTCFITLAESMGLADEGPPWRVTLEPLPPGLETITPSGRVWDGMRFKWGEEPMGEPCPIDPEHGKMHARGPTWLCVRCGAMRGA